MSRDVASAQEHIIVGDLDVNRWMLAIRHTPLEKEFTVGSSQSLLVGKYFKGGSHIGYDRMSFRSNNVGTFQAAPGSYIWQVQVKYHDTAEGIPITMCFRIPPAANLMAASGYDYVIWPKGCDELGVTGTLQRKPCAYRQVPHC
jgi:3-polyprenyl-4-hydroxybenzoate decarboxylase